MIKIIVKVGINQAVFNGETLRYTITDDSDQFLSIILGENQIALFNEWTSLEYIIFSVNGITSSTVTKDNPFVSIEGDVALQTTSLEILGMLEDFNNVSLSDIESSTILAKEATSQSIKDQTDLIVADGATEASLETKSSQESVDVIGGVVDQINKLKRIGDTVTTDGTEQTIWIYDAPAAIIEPTKLVIDTTAHTATETLVITTYLRLKSGGNYIVFDVVTLTGVQSPLGLCLDLYPNLYGVKITVNKTAGTNRAYDYEVFFKER